MEMQEIRPFGAMWPFGRTRVSNEGNPMESNSSFSGTSRSSRDSVKIRLLMLLLLFYGKIDLSKRCCRLSE